MKKTALIIAAMAMATCTYAQKANVKKVQNMVDYASTPVNIDLGNLEQAKVEEIRELIIPALTNPESMGNYKTWEYAGRLHVYDKNQILKEYVANGNHFTDMKAFFQNEADIVEIYEQYYKLINTPNQKGKLPVKEDEIAKLKLLAQQITIPCRNNLYVGATQFVYSEPKYAVKLLELYYDSFENPLFDDVTMSEDAQKVYDDSSYIYATALKGAGGDTEKVMELLQKSLSTSNGALACQELITYYKDKGDAANENKYLDYAVQHFPNQLVFGINKAQRMIIDKDYDNTINLCNQLIQNIENGTISKVDDNGNELENIWYPYYFKAVSLFNSEKYEEAYNAFVAGDDACPGHIELVMGAGTSAAKFGNDNFSNKAVRTPWYEKAVVYLKKAEEAWPDQSEQWGYQLYACYHNLENKVMEEQYKKYVK